MKIRLKNFVIEDCLGINLYDLSKNVVVKSGKREGETDLRNVAYGVSLERCFTIILNETVEQELENTTLEFNQYLEVYQRVNKELKLEVQRLEVSLNKS